MKHEALTEKIIGICFDVQNELGSGFLESVYHKALDVALTDAGLKVELEKPIRVNFRGRPVGQFFADLIVEDVILMELKAVKTLVPEHSAQVINYLNATGTDVGLLVNFGNAKLQFKRLHPKS